MPKTTLENVGRRRLTPKGSRAPNELELDLPDLKPGEGQLLPSGEIAINDRKLGILVLRADNAYAYIPKLKTANPLDQLVTGSSEDEDDEPEKPEPGAKSASKESAESDDAPLIDGGKKGLGPDALGSVTGGSGIGAAY